MDKTTLEKFEHSDGWDAGIDGSIAITTLGTGKDFTIENSKEPVIGFAFGMRGLMGNLTLEGTKITRVRK
jgi:lipid-binding SYLF domain-containing protein